MYLESAQLLQLSIAILGAIIILFAANAAPIRVSIGILLFMIPFQPVSTSYGSINVAMTFVLVAALMLRGRLPFAPVIGSILAVLFAYLISISRLPRSVYSLHGIEFIALVSGFLVFILAYNLARNADNRKFIVGVLMYSNLLSLAYCLVQLGVDPGESIELFGSKDFTLNKNRGSGDARLVGPFGSPGITAAYFMTMSLIVLYEAVHTRGRRRLLAVLLLGGNVVMMVATANRGSFLVLCLGLLAFLYLFRAELGTLRIMRWLVVATVLLVGSGMLLTTYTEYGQLFVRLTATTEMEDGMPATRAVVWPNAIESIKEKPIIGHGPRLLVQHELRYLHVPDEQLVSTYPHSLYLYLLVTVGIFGTACMLFFLFGVLFRIYSTANNAKSISPYERGWIWVGVIVVGTFLVDELKIEFLRNTTVDYAHFVFAIFGIFLGWADNARQKIANSAAQNEAIT